MKDFYDILRKTKNIVHREHLLDHRKSGPEEDVKKKSCRKNDRQECRNLERNYS